jgi:hypothetical protein
MSAGRVSSPFIAAIWKPILMLSRVTMEEYVNCVGASVQCPPATYQALQVKSHFTSKIMWNGIHCDPGGTCSPSSRYLNATALFLISFMMAWCHRSVPDKWFSSYTSSTVFGNLIPYLWVCLRYHVLMASDYRFSAF